MKINQTSTFEMCQKVVIHDDDDDDEEEKSYHLSIDPCDGYIVEKFEGIIYRKKKYNRTCQ